MASLESYEAIVGITLRLLELIKVEGTVYILFSLEQVFGAEHLFFAAT